MNDTHLTQQAFSGLGLPEPLLAGVLGAGFTHCTPIQAATLPKALAGHDVAGQAQTGTGKTAAFLLAVFNRLLTVSPPPDRRPNQPRALILAPTRELAIQIHKDALVLGQGCAQSVQLAYGGTGYESQRKAIEEGVDILIGTPGRLIDYFKQHVFDLRALEVMVLDEADRMFDLGFIKDIRYLLHRMPPVDKRLSLLFSATLSYRVMELAYEHMNNPELVRIEAEKITAERVRERLYHVAQEEKLPVLVGLLRREQVSRGLVFTNTKHAAERVQGWLEANDFAAAVLSGDVPQQKRQSLLADFQGGAFSDTGRYRRGGAWSAHTGREPRLQLRPPAGRRRLCASHRANGARRGRRRGGEPGVRRVRLFAHGYRGLHRPQDPGGARHGRPDRVLEAPGAQGPARTCRPPCAHAWRVHCA